MKKRTFLSIVAVLTLSAPSTIIAADTNANSIYSVSVNLVRAKAYKNVAQRINDLLQRTKTYILNTGDFSPTTKKVVKFYKADINSWKNFDKNGIIQVSTDNKNNRFIIKNIGSAIANSEKQAKIFLNNNVLDPSFYAKTNPKTKTIELPLTLYKPYGFKIISFKKLYDFVKSQDPNAVISSTAPSNTAKTWYKPDGKGNLDKYIYKNGNWQFVEKEKNETDYFNNNLAQPQTNQDSIIVKSYADLSKYNSLNNGTVGYVVDSKTKTSVPYVLVNGVWMPIQENGSNQNGNSDNAVVNSFIAWNDKETDILTKNNINFIKINGRFFAVSPVNYSVEDVWKTNTEYRNGGYEQSYDKVFRFGNNFDVLASSSYKISDYLQSKDIYKNEYYYDTIYYGYYKNPDVSLLSEADKKLVNDIRNYIILPYQNFVEKLKSKEGITVDEEMNNHNAILFTADKNYKIIKYPYVEAHNISFLYKNIILKNAGNIDFPYYYNDLYDDTALIRSKGKSLFAYKWWKNTIPNIISIPNDIIQVLYNVENLDKKETQGGYVKTLVSGDLLIAKNGSVYAVFESSMGEKSKESLEKTIDSILKNRSYSTDYIDKTTFVAQIPNTKGFSVGLVKINPFESPDERIIEFKKIDKYHNLFVTNKGNLYVTEKYSEEDDNNRRILKKVDSNVMYAMPIYISDIDYATGILTVKKDGTINLWIRGYNDFSKKHFTLIKSFKAKDLGLSNISPNNIMDITKKAIFYKDGSVLTVALEKNSQPNTIALKAFKIDKSKLTPDIFKIIRKNQMVIDKNGNIQYIGLDGDLLGFKSTAMLKLDFPNTPLNKLVLISNHRYTENDNYRIVKNDSLAVYSPITHKMCTYSSLNSQSSECVENVGYFYILNDDNILYYDYKNHNFKVLTIHSYYWSTSGLCSYGGVGTDCRYKTNHYRIYAGIGMLNKFVDSQKNVNFEFFTKANLNY